MSPHPNVVRVIGVCVDAPDDALRIVTEWCPFGDLQKYMDTLAKVSLGLYSYLCILSPVDTALARPFVVVLLLAAAAHQFCVVCAGASGERGAPSA